MMESREPKRYLVVFEGMATAARLLGSLQVSDPHGLVFQTSTARIIAVDLSNGSEEVQLHDALVARCIPVPGSALVLGESDLSTFKEFAGDVAYTVHPLEIDGQDVDVA